MNAEFNWWLLIVGLVLGAGLVWLVLADSRRRDVDVTDDERASEARWIAEAMADAGRRVDDDEIREVLRLHGEYLGLGPPAEPLDVDATVSDARLGVPAIGAQRTDAVGRARDSDVGRPAEPTQPAIAQPGARADDPERRVSES